jgi:hypothetical protein
MGICPAADDDVLLVMLLHLGLLMCGTRWCVVVVRL